MQGAVRLGRVQLHGTALTSPPKRPLMVQDAPSTHRWPGVLGMPGSSTAPSSKVSL